MNCTSASGRGRYVSKRTCGDVLVGDVIVEDKDSSCKRPYSRYDFRLLVSSSSFYRLFYSVSLCVNIWQNPASQAHAQFFFRERNLKFGRKLGQIVSNLHMTWPRPNSLLRKKYINATCLKAQSSQGKLNLNEHLTIPSSAIIEHAGHVISSRNFTMNSTELDQNHESFPLNIILFSHCFREFRFLGDGTFPTAKNTDPDYFRQFRIKNVGLSSHPFLMRHAQGQAHWRWRSGYNFT